MILALFDAVPTGAIETLFDEQNQPLLKRADLGKYLGIKNIKETYRDIETIPRKYVLNEGALVAPPKEVQSMVIEGTTSRFCWHIIKVVNYLWMKIPQIPLLRITSGKSIG